MLIPAVQIKHQHLFVTHDFFRQRAFLVHLALIVQRGVFIQVMGGIDQELALALAAQHHADGINAEVALDLPGNLRHQLVEVEFRQHRVSDGNQQTKVVAFPAQHLIAVATVLAGHQLLDRQTRRLGQRLQPGKIAVAPGAIVVAQELAATKDPTVRRQRRQAIVGQGGVQIQAGQRRPGLFKGLCLAVQHVRARQHAAKRPVRQQRLIFIADIPILLVGAVQINATLLWLPEQNVRAIGQVHLPGMPGQ